VGKADRASSSLGANGFKLDPGLQQKSGFFCQVPGFAVRRPDRGRLGPSSGGAENPPLTIVTLAVRRADYIARETTAGNI
jgi:hypothetical protein